MDDKFDEKFEDLKHFIDGRISQSEAQMDERLEEVAKDIRQEMRDGFAGVGEAFNELHKQIAGRDKEVDNRLTRLEQKAA